MRPAPSAELAEPLVVRPTSETIIGASFAKWVQSYRDLPILINQWANVVRWELRPRLFLRTTEFLWQEGHTAHESEREAIEEAMQMLDVYATLLAIIWRCPFSRRKIRQRTFPGAVQTSVSKRLCRIEEQFRPALRIFSAKILQRHPISNLFREGKQEFGWTTSWGISTRLVGTVMMTHGDDDGAVLPPRIAPAHVVILPITPKEETNQAVLEAGDSSGPGSLPITMPTHPIGS